MEITPSLATPLPPPHGHTFLTTFRIVPIKYFAMYLVSWCVYENGAISC